MIDTPLAAEPPFKLSTEQLNTGVLQLYVVLNGTIPFTILCQKIQINQIKNKIIQNLNFSFI